MYTTKAVLRFEKPRPTAIWLVQMSPASGLDGSAYLRVPIRPAR